MKKMTANQIDSRRILLEKYLRGECTVPLSPQIRKVSRKVSKRGTVVSLSQEQLWLHAQEYAAIPEIYTESITIYRNGPLDLKVMNESLREILRRHELWRSSFEVGEDGRLLQVVEEETEFPLAVVDLSAWPASQQEREATRIATAQAQQPFDVRRGRLVRATLVSLGDQQHRLY